MPKKSPKYDHPHSVHHKAGFFKRKPKPKEEDSPPTQQVTVTVTINEKDDSVASGCFKFLCGLGKKAAVS